MSRAYTYTTKEIERILKRNGYTHVRTTGSHRIFTNGVNTIPLVLKVNKMVALRTIKKFNLDVNK